MGGEGRSETPIGSAIVAIAAAIVTTANVVMAAVVEPQQSWSSTKEPLSLVVVAVAVNVVVVTK